MLEKDFFQNVFEVVKLVPRGRVTTYGAIAEYLGAKRSARIVGWAMNAVNDKEIPAHRVVNGKGMLSGKAHFQPPELMQQRLEEEGILVKNDRVLELDRVLWLPMKELSI